MIQLIVGLANPGKEYTKTRHNVGAWFVEALAKQADIVLRFQNKFHGLYAFGTIENNPCHLLIPTTFMNHSGQSVNACMHYYKIEPNQILIVHDEIDLPVGSIKLKLAGGDGGHNGLKDVIKHLDTKNFYRLRIGVGHPGESSMVSDYVLSSPSKSDHEKIADVIQKAQAILPLILKGEMQKAMHQLHTEKN